MGCNCNSVECEKSHKKNVNNLIARLNTLKVLNPSGVVEYNSLLDSLRGCPEKQYFSEVKIYVYNEYAKYT